MAHPKDLTPKAGALGIEKPVMTLEMQRNKDRELVKGIFKYYEGPGGVMDFVYKKYEGDDVDRYTMIDGHVYTIPLGVAKHINNNTWYPVHDHIMDKDGNNIQAIVKKVKRCGFQSLEFMDTEEFDRGGTQIIHSTNKAIPA
jgi:hypothetical protein